MKIPKIVITGGSCGGKTTGLSNLKERLNNLGFCPIIIPEAATIFYLSGFKPEHFGGFERFDLRLLKMKLWQEEFFENCAIEAKKNGVRPILLFDRGLMDGRAYNNKASFEKMLQALGLSSPEALLRYDAVIHLRSAAIGAENHYSKENNSARQENLEQARELDGKILNCWIGHNRLIVINNETNFEDKIKRLFNVICNILGTPEPMESERKFIVEPIDISKLPIDYEAIKIEQIYLEPLNDKQEIRIRKRIHGGMTSYHIAQKSLEANIKRLKIEKIISEKEYENQKCLMKSRTVVINKTRYCFLYKDHHFELDVFVNPHNGLCLLEVYADPNNGDVEIPPFIKVTREVTCDPSFLNSKLATV